MAAQQAIPEALTLAELGTLRRERSRATLERTFRARAGGKRKEDGADSGCGDERDGDCDSERLAHSTILELKICSSKRLSLSACASRRPKFALVITATSSSPGKTCTRLPPIPLMNKQSSPR